MFNLKKKGALELSITAIVVLIIAITVLGLAIFFIKNLFGESTELLKGRLAQIKDQLKEDMVESGELVSFSEGAELKLKRGEKKEFYIGIRNSGGVAQCYRLAMICKRPFDPNGVCTDEVPTDALVGGKTLIEDLPVQTWFPKMLSEFTIRGGDVEVSPVTLQIATANPDTYRMELEVYQAGEDCSFISDQPWQTKSFHIMLS